jgi:hypothetical protein
MYTLTDAELSAFQSSNQHVTIAFTSGETELTITDADLTESSLSVSRNSTSGSNIEIGSVIAAELTMTLNNRTGAWNNITLEGASLFVSVTAGNVTVPIGYYTIDSAIRNQYTINITALDRMMQFDKTVTSVTADTISGIIEECCTACNVPCGVSDWSGYPLAGLVVSEIPENLTYRTLLAYCCEVLGTNAWIDYNGRFQCAWYGSTNLALTPSNRQSGDIADSAVSITGIQLDDTLYGTEGYIIKIEGNPFASDTVGNSLLTSLGGFTYYPFSARTLPLPHVWPMDMGTYRKNSTDYPIIITGWKYRINGWNDVAGVGESETISGYASANPLTRAEQAIIEKAAIKQTETLNNRIQMLLQLNDIASNSLGFHTTSEMQADGSIIVYTHDKPTLADSTVIFKKTSAGFFVSTDGGQTYVNGYDAETGTAVVNILSAIGIKAEWLDIDGVIQRINADGTESIDSAHVSVDGTGLKSIIGAINDAIVSNTALIQDANSLTLLVQSQVQSVEHTAESNESELETLRTWITANADGLSISKSTSNFSSLFTESDLEFLENGNVIAYFGNQKFYISNGEITGELLFRHGSSGTVTAYWTMNSNGHLVLKKGN